MDAPRIALVVGNGFSLGFNAYTGLQTHWNTQTPLAWNIRAPGANIPLLDGLPSLKVLRNSFPNLTDFDFFILAKDRALCKRLGLDPMQTIVEARHYITLAFSYYSIAQRRAFSTSWNWFRWISAHRADICGAVSFNYDLLLETCFDHCGKLHYSWQENHHGAGIPLVKPHGSINMEISERFITVGGPITYPIGLYMELCDGPVCAMPESEWVTGRKAPLCIVPNEANAYRHFQFVAPAYEAFFTAVRTCTHCVFIGLSYWTVDRPEIDEIINILPKNTEIIVANPSPPPEFLTRVNSHPVVTWTSFDGPLSVDGELIYLKNADSGKMYPRCFCRSGLSYRDCCGRRISAT